MVCRDDVVRSEHRWNEFARHLATRNEVSVCVCTAVLLLVSVNSGV
jgi:hypothetical protein